MHLLAVIFLPAHPESVLHDCQFPDGLQESYVPSLLESLHLPVGTRLKHVDAELHSGPAPSILQAS
jgi:hypothetical protein